MPGRASDPYAVLGVTPDVSDAELRSAYRRLVKLHHPDHNGGSEESERRFEQVQDAYARARSLRATAGSGNATAGDGGVDARLAEMERQLREAQQARERAEQLRSQARRAAREAAAAASAGSGAERKRPSDEELGYVTTDDSLSKILADAREAIADRVDELAEKLTGEGRGS
jgi:curved DNA-binding protein CbpA